ncbi:TPA: hypothetical protein ACGBG5_003487 [Enterococcus faecalis]
MANLANNLPIKNEAFKRIITMEESTSTRIQGVRMAVRKYSVTTDSVSSLNLYVRNPKKGEVAEPLQELTVENVKLEFLRPNTSGQRGNQNQVDYLRVVAFADRVSVNGPANFETFETDPEQVLDIKTNGREKREWISKHTDYEKLFGTLRFKSANAHREFFDGVETGELEGYDVTVICAETNKQFVILVDDLNFPYGTLRPFIDFIEIVNPSISNIFVDSSDVEAGTIAMSLKADTIRKTSSSKELKASSEKLEGSSIPESTPNEKQSGHEKENRPEGKQNKR